MISDTLFDAVGDIRDYLNDPAFAHVYGPGPLRDRIEALLVEMDAIRQVLDTPPGASGGNVVIMQCAPALVRLEVKPLMWAICPRCKVRLELKATEEETMRHNCTIQEDRP